MNRIGDTVQPMNPNLEVLSVGGVWLCWVVHLEAPIVGCDDSLFVLCDMEDLHGILLSVCGALIHMHMPNPSQTTQHTSHFSVFFLNHVPDHTGSQGNQVVLPSADICQLGYCHTSLPVNTSKTIFSTLIQEIGWNWFRIMDNYSLQMLTPSAKAQKMVITSNFQQLSSDGSLTPLGVHPRLHSPQTIYMNLCGFS